MHQPTTPPTRGPGTHHTDIVPHGAAKGIHISSIHGDACMYGVRRPTVSRERRPPWPGKSINPCLWSYLGLSPPTSYLIQPRRWRTEHQEELRAAACKRYEVGIRHTDSMTDAISC